MSERLIAVCGIDCTDCPLRAADTDEGAAQALAGWFRDMGWIEENEGAPEIMARGPYCRGCRGDRDVHWSANCWILECCVDDKSLASCHECQTFPCEQLVEWAAQNDRYTEALDRLHSIKEAAA
jgi:hypothetical protein